MNQAITQRDCSPILNKKHFFSCLNKNIFHVRSISIKQLTRKNWANRLLMVSPAEYCYILYITDWLWAPFFSITQSCFIEIYLLKKKYLFCWDTKNVCSKLMNNSFNLVLTFRGNLVDRSYKSIQLMPARVYILFDNNEWVNLEMHVSTKSANLYLPLRPPPPSNNWQRQRTLAYEILFKSRWERNWMYFLMCLSEPEKSSQTVRVCVYFEKWV